MAVYKESRVKSYYRDWKKLSLSDRITTAFFFIALVIAPLFVGIVGLVRLIFDV